MHYRKQAKPRTFFLCRSSRMSRRTGKVQDGEIAINGGTYSNEHSETCTNQEKWNYQFEECKPWRTELLEPILPEKQPQLAECTHSEEGLIRNQRTEWVFISKQYYQQVNLGTMLKYFTHSLGRKEGKCWGKANKKRVDPTIKLCFVHLHESIYTDSLFRKSGLMGPKNNRVQKFRSTNHGIHFWMERCGNA